MKQISKLIKSRKYESLLFSLLLMLFGEIIIPKQYVEILDPLFIIQNILVSFIVFQEERKRFRIGVLAILILISILEVMNFFTPQVSLRILMFIVFIVYFIFISFKVYSSIFKAKEVGVKMVSAVFCGFIMLVMIGGFMFVIIEIIHPNSFSNLGAANEMFQNIQYFSFITSLTIGYGDIAPLTLLAKKAVMLVGITGNFYTVFITGIVIGKFINSDKNA